ncbi:MAG: tetratricopeptide repeat protein [Bacteroidia bacterium]
MQEKDKPEIQANCLNEQAWAGRYGNTEQSLKDAEKAMQLSQSCGYARGIAYATLYRAVCAFLLSKDQDHMLSDLISALHYFDETGDKLGQLRTLNYLGNVYDTYGQYDKGLDACQRGLKIGNHLGNQEGLGDILSTTGTIYFRIGDYDHAFEAYQQSCKLREGIPDLKAVASSLNMIARTYTAKDDFINGLDYYKQSIRLREELGELTALPWSYLGLASLFEKQGNEAEALRYYRHCTALNEGGRDKRLALYCQLGLGRYELGRKNPDEGITKLQVALKIAEALQAKALLYEIHALFSSLYEQKGDTAQALNYFRTYHELKEEVLNAESGNRLKNQQIAFAVERSEQEAEIHRLRNIELKAAYDSIEEKNKDITASISYARRIQQAMLPRKGFLQDTCPDSFIFFKPKDIVSGDFYWIGKGKGKSVYVAVADCTGHGVPGAFMSMLGIEKLNEALAIGESVSDMLQNLNKGMKKALGQTGQEGETRDGMDIALLEIKGESGIHYAGANRPLWVLRSNEELIEEIKATKVAIGGYTADEQEFPSTHLKLNPGDVVYIFSDGYADQFGKGGKKLKSSKWKELILSVRHLSLADQGAYFEEFLNGWKEEQEQTDDILVIGIRF